MLNLTAYNNLGNKLNQAEAIAYFLQESNQSKNYRANRGQK